MRQPQTRRRFTLVELLTVMAIIAILMGLVLGITRVAHRMIYESRTKAIIAQISVALENYKAKYGYYIQSDSAKPDKFLLDVVDSGSSPSADQKITNNFGQFIDYQSMTSSRNSMNTNPINPTNGRYYLIDGYRQPLVYRCPGYFNRSGFDLGSVGEDGKWGASTTALDPSNISGATTSYQNDFGKGDDITNFSR